MLDFRHLIWLACLVFWTPLLLHAQGSKLDLTQPYLLLATGRTSTMQKELDEAAASGYRVLLGSRTTGGEIGLLLQKIETTTPYQYRLLATRRTSTMQKELNQAAGEGFRMLPRTLMGGEGEIVLVLEKSPDAPPNVQYLLLATKQTGTLQREMTQAARNGFALISVVSRGEHMVILEKSSAAPTGEPDANRKYLLLATEKTSTMQKELDNNAATGYRLMAGSPTSQSEIAMFMEQVTETTGTFKYKLLATTRTSTLQNELNVAGGDGFHLLWQTVSGKRGSKGGFLGRMATRGMSLAADEIVGVMELNTNFTKRYEYLVLDTSRTRTMQSELSKAVQDGYVPAAIVRSPSGDSSVVPIGGNPVGSNLIVILERSIPRSGK